jgi:hypothetical protein
LPGNRPRVIVAARELGVDVLTALARGLGCRCAVYANPPCALQRHALHEIITVTKGAPIDGSEWCLRNDRACSHPGRKAAGYAFG